MTKINREKLVGELESVYAGLSSREILTQSSCFAFKSGEVMTFNDEVACRSPTSLNIEGAVSAKPLLSILQKLKAEYIDISINKDRMNILGKNSKTSISLEKEVELPIDSVEVPEKWKSLHNEFRDAADMVRQCASNNEAEQKITCVHIHPNWIEASDNIQLTRYTVETGVSESVLIKHSSVKSVVELGVTKVCLTDNWVHFKNPAGLIISCRRYMDQFPDLSKFLEVEGRKITLPKGLSDIVDKAEVFSSENSEENIILVEMSPGLLKIKGTGVSGWHVELKKLAYKGDHISFNISPKLLVQITEKYNEVIINQKRMKVKSGNYCWVTCLGVPRKDKDGFNEKSEKD